MDFTRNWGIHFQMVKSRETYQTQSPFVLAKSNLIARPSALLKNILIRIWFKAASDIQVKVRFLNPLPLDRKYSFKIYMGAKTNLCLTGTFNDKV